MDLCTDADNEGFILDRYVLGATGLRQGIHLVAAPAFWL
jgi:hypothetical protein